MSQLSINQQTMASSIWERCLNYIKDVIQEQNYKQYFANTKAVAINEGHLYVEVLNQSTYDYLKLPKVMDLVLRSLRSEQMYLQIEYSLPTAGSVWERCQAFIKDNLDPSPYQKWFSQIQAVSFDEQKLILQLPSKETLDMLENHYFHLLSASIRKEIGNGIQLCYKIIPLNDRGKDKGRKDETTQLKVINNIDTQLQEEYTFLSFAKGDENLLCHKVGMDIAQNPGKGPFNPLFIYGSTGVGKTHLVQAIGNMCRQVHPEKVILYISGPRFIEHFQICAANKKINDFVQLYQTIEVLIIDDIQFFTNAPKTQDVFFNIFNHLHQSMGRQIILSSDRRPQELEQVHDRLISRFTCGLQEELKPPGEKLRYEILKSKCLQDEMDIPEEVLLYIAKHCHGNGRDLNGVRNHLMVRAIHLGQPINVHMAQEALQAYLPKATTHNNTIISCEKIINAVAEYFQIPSSEITKKGRGKQELSEIRQIAMFLSRTMTNTTLKQIGKYFGGKDHSTVKYACEIVEKNLELDPKVHKHIDTIKQKINSK